MEQQRFNCMEAFTKPDICKNLKINEVQMFMKL